MSGWTAVVLAGSRPGRDALADRFGTDLKALIPVAGEPMVRRPVAALLASKRIDRVLVLAQDPARLAKALPKTKRLTIARSGATIAATLEALCCDRATQWPLLVTTADHALLDAAMIDDFCLRAAGADVAIAIVERRTLLARLPQTQRTWIPLKGGAYSGANLFAFGSIKVLSALELWRSVEQDRKKGWRLLSILGPALALGALLRLMTIEQLTRRIGTKLGLQLRPVQMRDPLAAVDVDKVEDHALVEALIEGRA